jgi:hypothetical protein
MDTIGARRAGKWDPGVYSIVRFDLEDQGPDTRLVFEHSAFPAGEAASLARGWSPKRQSAEKNQTVRMRPSTTS